MLPNNIVFVEQNILITSFYGPFNEYLNPIEILKTCSDGNSVWLLDALQDCRGVEAEGEQRLSYKSDEISFTVEAAEKLFELNGIS